MSAIAGPPPSWNGSTKLAIERQVHTMGCFVQRCGKIFEIEQAAKGEDASPSGERES